MGHPSARPLREDTLRVFLTLPVFPHSPMMTICPDGLAMKGLVDTGADIAIITETEALGFPHWKSLDPAPPSVKWEDRRTPYCGPPGTLEGHRWQPRFLFSRVADVPCNLWGWENIRGYGRSPDQRLPPLMISWPMTYRVSQGTPPSLRHTDPETHPQF